MLIKPRTSASASLIDPVATAGILGKGGAGIVGMVGAVGTPTLAGTGGIGAGILAMFWDGGGGSGGKFPGIMGMGYGMDGFGNIGCICGIVPM